MVEQVKAMVGHVEGAGAGQSGVAGSGEAPGLFALWNSGRQWLALAVIACAVLCGYFVALLAPALLDEQFLRACAVQSGHAGVPFNVLMGFRGFDALDLWGPLTPLVLKASATVACGTLWLERFFGMLIHFAGALCLFTAAKRMQAGYWLSLAAAVLFALFPLSAEAVTWLGGRGAELGVCLFLSSLCAYQRARGYLEAGSSRLPAAALPGIDWKWLAVSLLLFLGSLTATAAMWVGAPVFLCYELLNWLFNVDSRDRQDPSQPMIGSLSFVVLAGAYFAASGLLSLFAAEGVRPHFSFSSFCGTLRNIVFPINQSIWHGYGQQYRLLYFLFPPFLLALPLALVRDRRFARLFAFSLSWFLLSLIPSAGHAAQGTDLYGSRWLYFAAAPFSLMVSLLFAGFYFGFRRLRPVAAGVCALAVFALSVFYLGHLSNQNSAYRVGGRVLAAVQKSVKIVVAKTGVPFVLVRDVPQYVAVSPLFSLRGMVALDGTTAAFASPAIPDGRLRDALKEKRYLSTALRWEKDFQSLIPLELTPEQNTFPAQLDAEKIAGRLIPRLELLKTVSLAREEKLLLLESNSAQGPIIRLDGEGLSPVDGDFLYIDARIMAPPPAQKPLIELYWQTRAHDDYDNKERRTWCTAVLNDNQFHRYYLPLRSTGWATNGPISLITLGFPAGARVSLKAMGVVAGDALLPKLALSEQKQESGGEPSGLRFAAPYFNFPEAKDLGLTTVSSGGQGIVLSHSVEQIPGAEGVLIEISRVNRNFENANGNELSAVTGKTIGLMGRKGTYSISCKDFPPGVYRVRAIAVDGASHFIGNFSDAVAALVR